MWFGKRGGAPFIFSLVHRVLVGFQNIHTIIFTSQTLNVDEFFNALVHQQALRFVHLELVRFTPSRGKERDWNGQYYVLRVAEWVLKSVSWNCKRAQVAGSMASSVSSFTTTCVQTDIQSLAALHQASNELTISYPAHLNTFSLLSHPIFDVEPGVMWAKQAADFLSLSRGSLYALVIRSTYAGNQDTDTSWRFPSLRSYSGPRELLVHLTPSSCLKVIQCYDSRERCLGAPSMILPTPSPFTTTFSLLGWVGDLDVLESVATMMPNLTSIQLAAVIFIELDKLGDIGHALCRLGGKLVRLTILIPPVNKLVESECRDLLNQWSIDLTKLSLGGFGTRNNMQPPMWLHCDFEIGEGRRWLITHWM
ncbi:hypothetical protein PM082_008812 [Marasmius tenuissimus]|nr:hypothetical protein PM082_008812 [Marasmius tenuissimus]